MHEPNAEELQPDIVLQDRFDHGRQVGAIDQTRFPGGVLIDFPYREVDAKITATKAALEAGAPSIFEASFLSGTGPTMGWRCECRWGDKGTPQWGKAEIDRRRPRFQAHSDIETASPTIMIVGSLETLARK